MMFQDKGLNGNFDRLPMLTGIMFLKFLDDLELQRKQEWKLVNPTPGLTSSSPAAAGPPSTHRNKGKGTLA